MTVSPRCLNGIEVYQRQDKGLLLVVGHGSAGQVTALHANIHLAILHSHHLGLVLLLLLSKVWAHLPKKLLLLVLLQARLLL